MTADAANRWDVIQTFVGLANTAMLDCVDDIFDYEEANIESRTSLMILAGGTKRQKSGINDTRWRNKFLIEVLVFVEKANTLTDIQGGTNWTSRDVEKKLADVDKALADLVANNRANAGWSFIDFADDYSTIVEGRSRPYEPPESQQTNYKIESYTLVVDYVEG